MSIPLHWQGEISLLESSLSSKHILQVDLPSVKPTAFSSLQNALSSTTGTGF